MGHFSLQQNAMGRCDENGGLVSDSNLNGPVVCPKPRRVGCVVSNPIRPLRWRTDNQADVSDSRAGAELLDIILMKEDHGAEEYTSGAASPPPFFSGSPPARVSNPLTQDAQFVQEKLTPISKVLILSPSEVLPPSASPRKGGCVKMKFGFKQAEVRVEGFNCLNRDCQTSRIPAMA